MSKPPTHIFSYVIICLDCEKEKLSFRGVYWHNGNGKTGKLFGSSKLPSEIRPTMVDKFYKYDPALKVLKSMIGTKLFNANVDAVSLLPDLGKKVILQKRAGDNKNEHNK